MKPLKKTLAWALVDDHGRLWLDEWDGQPTLSTRRGDLVQARESYQCPKLWRIVRVEIKEVTKNRHE